MQISELGIREKRPATTQHRFALEGRGSRLFPLHLPVISDIKRQRQIERYRKPKKGNTKA